MQHGKLALRIAGIDFRNLVFYIHLDEVRRRGRLRRGHGRGGGRHRSGRKQRVPRLFAHDAILLQAVIALKFGHSRLGAVIKARSHLALIKAQLKQPLLHLLNALARIASLQFARIGDIGRWSWRRDGGRRGRRRWGRQGNRARIEQLQRFHISLARSLQAVITLECRHSGAGIFQVLFAQLILIIAVSLQRLLQALHARAGHAVFQRTVALAIDNRLRGSVGNAGLLQIVGILHGLDGFARNLGKGTAERAVIVFQFLQARLQAKHLVARIAELQPGRIFGIGRCAAYQQRQQCQQQSSLHAVHLTILTYCNQCVIIL